MAYLDQFSVIFGTAASVTRNVQSHTSGSIAGASDVLTINGRVYGGGGGGGEITTTHRNVEQGIILTDNGEEHPYSIWINDPFLRDGSRCAVTMRHGKPVVITNMVTGWRYWINGGPEADTPHRKGVKRWLIMAAIIGGIALVVFQNMYPWHRTIWNYVPFAVAAFLAWVGLKNVRSNDANETDRMEKQKLRTDFLESAIARHKAESAAVVTGT